MFREVVERFNSHKLFYASLFVAIVLCFPQILAFGHPAYYQEHISTFVIWSFLSFVIFFFTVIVIIRKKYLNIAVCIGMAYLAGIAMAIGMGGSQHFSSFQQVVTFFSASIGLAIQFIILAPWLLTPVAIFITLIMIERHKEKLAARIGLVLFIGVALIIQSILFIQFVPPTIDTMAYKDAVGKSGLSLEERLNRCHDLSSAGYQSKWECEAEVLAPRIKATQDIKDCEYYESLTSRVNCYLDLSETWSEAKRLPYCNVLRGLIEPGFGEMGYAKCITRIVVAAQDPYGCEKVPGQGYKDHCYDLLASKTADATYCNKISNTDTRRQCMR